ncbi:gluconate 2-dehydrogenase subunit 3 family protein [Herbaspirillum sp. WKF16]|uniref:gluconate 2-dehydrogenase subunit 3 family protein n=1 Tax=Herbaspirillum sp. WKF16 TaxID=3028312 RepID=UPI0023A96A63|nr:gluconate 2-dehydrogenase subunit 3 family protein [Herbaspirillum sp. WKF16]WDZ97416.1 gluconate 2-dehydrogenase subunit 3 family protein [Herbaspirillum sp. WKF16]
MSQDKEPRRRFLRQVLAIVPAASTLGGATAVAVSQPAIADSSEPGKPRAYTPTYFNAAEWAFINAAVDHLIPSDQYGAGALETGVPEFIDRQMETPYGAGKLWYMQGPFHPDSVPELGYQLSLVPRDIYRQGIAACNDWCVKNLGKVFAELDRAKQLDVLKQMEGGKIHFETVPAKTFFNFMLGNTKEGYFADPMYGGNQKMGGWKMVGFPGARADYLDWVDQYNVKYPYGPVSILGEKG